MEDLNPETAFDIVNRYLGWGDPGEPNRSGIWFVGIEEAENWGNLDIAKKQFKELELELIDGWYKNSFWEPTNSQLLKVIKEIAEEFGVSKEILWRSGCRIFQTNLYPLGKPNTNYWPSHYKELFNFGKQDVDRYKEEVEQDRFHNIKNRWVSSKPQATVCFGTSREYMKGFMEVFLNGSQLPLKKHPQHSIYYSDEKRILISQHPASHWWRKSGSDKEKLRIIKSKLKDEWKVVLP
mgnify:CR=1 FL=1